MNEHLIDIQSSKQQLRDLLLQPGMFLSGLLDINANVFNSQATL